MVFPSLFFNLEPGAVSQFSAFIVVAFSFLLNKWKKIMVTLLALVSLLIFCKSAFAIMAAPTGGVGNYYGNPSYYPYPSVYPDYMTNNRWNIGQSPYFTSGFCVECMRMQQQQQQQQIQPYWYDYGYNNYDNNRYPGAWNNTGLDYHYYPGTGEMIAGKPNIYFEAKKGTKIKLKINFEKRANLLAAVPVHGNSGWEFSIDKEGNLLEKGAKYSYLFYDYRLHLDGLQAEKGFCTSRDLIMPRLEGILYQLDFKLKEVADFNEYWSHKLPESEEYCVYPQIEKELKRSAAYIISPPPSKVTRVNFVILTKEVLGKSILKKFAKRPSSAWKVPADRKIAAKEDFQVREWGVSFWVAK